MGLVERQNDQQVELALHSLCNSHSTINEYNSVSCMLFRLFSCGGDVAYYERHLIHRRYVNSLTLSPHGSTN